MAIRISKPARNLLPRNSVIKVVEAGEVKFKVRTADRFNQIVNVPLLQVIMTKNYAQAISFEKKQGGPKMVRVALSRRAMDGPCAVM